MAFFMLLIFFNRSFAQNEGTVRGYSLDSVVVRERVRNKIDEVTVGTRISLINTTVLQGNQTKSLAELLSDNSMVYIKSLGQGALSTSSFRGTSSGHTQVNWNGININPVMSGSFDFSQIPVFFADQVSLYHGSGHLKGGTGALGGSINIGNKMDWRDTNRINAFVEAASYDTYTAAASASLRGRNTLCKTRFYYQESDNDYRYLNKVLKLEDFYENRKEADYKIAGFMQEGYLKMSANATLSAIFWIQGGERRLPQPIIVNVTQHEKQRDVSIKSLVEYKREREIDEVSIKAAYISTLLDYEKWFDSDYFPAEESMNRAKSIHLTADYITRISKKVEICGSARYTHDWVKANSYSDNSVVRDVFSFQAVCSWKVAEWLNTDLHTMIELNDAKVAPTFSAGLNSNIIKGCLDAKVSMSYNYRFPTLNDLYWQPGGNKNLVPEHGFSYDATLLYKKSLGDFTNFKTELTAYVMNINDWIMWLPTMNWYWEPRNVQNVLSYGVESFTECNVTIDKFSARLAFNYTYSPSVNRERNFEEDDTYYKQLPYVPINKSNLRLAMSWRKLFLTYQVCYTGKRYTSADESYSTKAYTVHDMELKLELLHRRGYKITPKLRVDNIFNAYYESTQYYPMPLRIVSASIMINI